MIIENWHIDKLIEYARNPRKNDHVVDKIASAIREFGFRVPVIAKSDGSVVDGHLRIKAARKLGLNEIPVVMADDLTDAQIKAFRISVNRMAEFAEWDTELLNLELQELKSMDFNFEVIGFDPPDVVETTKGLTDEDDAPAPEKNPVSKPGDLWILGRHRLFCGDSTMPESFERLMGNEQADQLVTDPPYNVNYEGKTKDALKIKNDQMNDQQFRDFLHKFMENSLNSMKPGATFYVWHADSEGYNFWGSVKDCGEVVRQCLIWVKQTMVMGRQDYHWKHEPCQPPGTMVRTPDGYTAIELLKDGDRVVSYNRYSGTITGMRDGRQVKVASRNYSGNLYGIKANGNQTWVTDTHKFSVRFSELSGVQYCTYIMRRGEWWRVGVTSTYNSRGFGLKQRMRQEHADEAWILGTYKNKLEAFCAEQILVVRYGIPHTHWEVSRGIKTRKSDFRTDEMIHRIYDSIDLTVLRENACRLIADHGRRIDIPFIDKDSQSTRCSRRVTIQVPACNIIPEIMEVPIPYEKWDTENGKTFDWMPITAVETRKYDGVVYSLDVEQDEHYIADGIVTHNCLYGWKSGAGHLWATDRKQTTVLNFDRPSRSAEHPTMKPCALFAYCVQNNTKGGDLVLDPFLGSGTSIIACEKLGRRCYGLELDPVYCDVIIKRWQQFTGKKAVHELGHEFSA